MNRLFVQTAPLGDFLLSAPALQSWIDGGPAGTVQVVVRPGLEELARSLENVGPVHTLEKRWMRGGWSSLQRVRRAVREHRPEVVVAAQRSHRTSWVVRAAKAARAIGFATAPGRWAYSDSVEISSDCSVRDRYQQLVERAGGADCSGRSVRMNFPTELVSRVKRELGEHRSDPSRPLVALAPGAAWETKRWLPERFGELAKRLIEQGADILWVGAQSERELSQHGTLAEGHSIDWIGRTTLLELAVALQGVAQFIGNDSGTGHLANVLGVPTVTIFGPTASQMGYAPSGALAQVVEREGLECRPCHRHGPRRCPLGHFRCMREIEVEQVAAAAKLPG